ncbi:MAG: Nramp family divalent metal transporter [Acidobacteriota bacterium]|nr:Nramp family divalent metal transporter [Acidobacteriota bacterium]
MPLESLSSSLSEIHASVPTTHSSYWKRLFAFTGPAYLISVGYMDPGNWATDLEGGAKFGYSLLWVLVLSNLMAVLLQTLSARLGIISQRDLAQACRETYPRPVSFLLWVLCEIAIAACDLAEVLGAAIALNLLFHLPLLAGVLLTSLDTLLLLWFTRRGIRVVEGVVLALIVVIGACFAIELTLAGAPLLEMARGLIPKLTDKSLYIAIGILGATVMPHNLYLHSALVQTRRVGTDLASRTAACRFNLIDSAVALNAAMFINIAILVLAASVFFKRSIVVTEIQQAHLLLAPLLGTAAAGILFAAALLCSGQSSTLTGTLAGQVVMEGFLNIRMRPWLRRMLTRSMAITPAALTVYFAGEHGSYQLLILSQVILSLQLPFAVIPLIHFTNSRERMGAFANRGWVRILAWSTAILIVGLNARLVLLAVQEWIPQAGVWRNWILAGLAVALAGLSILLLWVMLEPIVPYWRRRFARAPVPLPELVGSPLPLHAYERILVPLDHSARDRDAVAHAAAMSRLHDAKLFLLHVEEDVTSTVYGSLASTAEVQAGEEYLSGIVDSLQRQGVKVEAVVRHSRNPVTQIIEYARELKPDLIVMGAHGHKGIKDLLFGTTINAVRHQLRTPLLVIRGDE